jgi:hypothetical protein
MQDMLSKCFIKDPAQRWSADKLLELPILKSISDPEKTIREFFNEETIV